MDVSIAICTWNRAALLEQTLERMRALAVSPDLRWEVLVVNNNCTDRTDDVIASFAGKLPIRRVVETTPGHSHARNRALQEFRGDLLLWTDDDVLVDSAWLTAHVAAFRDHPDAAYFAGPIEPWFEQDPPSWMSRHLRQLSGVIVCVDHGNDLRRLKLEEGIFGANLAVRGTVAREFPFNVKLGRVADVLTGGDDSDFISRLVGAGHHGLWVPGARIRHFVPKQRVTADYMNRWFRDAGRTYARQSKQLEGSRLAGIPRWVLREYVTAMAKAWLWRPTRNARWFESHRRAMMLRGIIHEARHSAH